MPGADELRDNPGLPLNSERELPGRSGLIEHMRRREADFLLPNSTVIQLILLADRSRPRISFVLVSTCRNRAGPAGSLVWRTTRSDTPALLRHTFPCSPEAFPE